MSGLEEQNLIEEVWISRGTAVSGTNRKEVPSFSEDRIALQEKPINDLSLLYD